MVSQPVYETFDTALLRVIEDSIAEDVGKGDITTQAVIPQGSVFLGVMRSREDLVVAGLSFLPLIFERLAPHANFEIYVQDGDRLPSQIEIMFLEGPAYELLTAERTALNLLQHLSGIATLTRSYVDRIEGTGAVLLDTRKTLPALRQLGKYATRMGGAQNHRMRLDDGVLIKDNHLAVAGGVSIAVERARQAGLSDIEVECDTLKQVEESIKAGADSVLLDNMTLEELRAAVDLCKGKLKTEASGGVTLKTIRDIAQTGVDYISVGRITQSASAVDIGLDWKSCLPS